MPKAARVTLLINRNGPTPEITLRDGQAAAAAMGLQMQVLHASTPKETVILAAHHKLPASYGNRTFADTGGLMTYGSGVSDAHRQAAVYAGRILKGAKPADLPLIQSTKVDLVINVQTARTLGLTVSPTLLARRGDRVTMLFAAVREFPGTKRPIQHVRYLVAVGRKADIEQPAFNKSDL